MAEDWSAIAQEVAGEIADVGFVVILEQPSTVNLGTVADPSYDPPQLVEVSALDGMIKKRDAEGVITEMVRSLIVQVSDVVPEKGWRVQVRGKWHRINQVWPLAPGGVDLMYKLELES